MKTATFIKKMDGWSSDARLYKLEPPANHEISGDYENTGLTEYVIVSAIIAPLVGAETYIFPANQDGETINMLEMEGSFRGGLDHEQALNNAGFEVKNETKP